MTDQEVQLFLADLAIIIPLSRPLGMGDAHLAVRNVRRSPMLCGACHEGTLGAR